MKRIIIFVAFAFTGCIFAGCADGGEQNANNEPDASSAALLDTNAVPNALPYSLVFKQQTFPNDAPPLPPLQSYSSTSTIEGRLLIIGGRSQGLHTFKSAPDTNFLPQLANNFIYVIDPSSGRFKSFNVDSLPAQLSAPLQSTNQQLYHDLETDEAYLVGGYGWNAEGSDMITFNSIIRFKVDDLVDAIQSGANAKTIAALFSVDQDDRFAVTGGELFKMEGRFYLVFGQKFMGQYRAFGGTDFFQKYTEEVRTFTLAPGTLKIQAYGASKNTDADQPFHRRDGNIVSDVDPKTGKMRISAFGGVFKPGIIGAYTNPVYINSPASPVVDRSGNQKFSQYECPVISMYDSSGSNPTTYHVFFGGIGHYYYWQTASQRAAFDTVTKQHRNDGFPFVADISSFQQSADGSYNEFIFTSPIPGNRLLGTSAKFIMWRKLMLAGKTYPNGVIKLARIASKDSTFIGFIYGGIEAQNPLPLAPNSGTVVSNSLFAVYLSRKPTSAIPASKGHESSKDTANLKR